MSRYQKGKTSLDFTESCADDVLVACISWTAIPNSKVDGSLRLSTANTLTACQLACSDTVDCGGVDFGGGGPVGWRCFLALGDPQPTVSSTGLSHYRLDRNCTGPEFYTQLYFATKCDSKKNRLKTGLN